MKLDKFVVNIGKKLDFFFQQTHFKVYNYFFFFLHSLVSKQHNINAIYNNSSCFFYF